MAWAAALKPHGKLRRGTACGGRLQIPEGKTEAELTEALLTLPDGLAHSRNLHAADVYPATSGKDNAARHLMQRFDAAARSALSSSWSRSRTLWARSSWDSFFLETRA